MALKYQRILLKISGEALGGEKGMGFDEPTMDAICANGPLIQQAWEDAEEDDADDLGEG